MFLGILYAGRIVYYKLFISGVGFNPGFVRSCQVSRGPTDQHETKGRECESTKKGDKGGEHNVNDVITLRTKDGVRIKNDVSVFFVSGRVWNGKPKPPQSTGPRSTVVASACHTGRSPAVGARGLVWGIGLRPRGWVRHCPWVRPLTCTSARPRPPRPQGSGQAKREEF